MPLQTTRTIRLVNRHKQQIWIFLILLGILTWVPSLQAEVNIQGSSTLLPMMKQAAKIFSKETGISIYVRGGGSSVGIKSIKEGKSDIGMVSRELTPKESANLQIHTIAYDGIAVITNTRNPINNLTHAQIVDIFTGKTKNWKQLGWDDKPIISVHNSQGRSTKELFEKHFGLKGKTNISGHKIGSNTEAIVFVAGDPWAIGYVSIGSAEYAKSIGVNVKPVSLNNISATSVNIANKKYPIRRPLNLVTQDTPNIERLMFLRFIKGARGYEIIKHKRFIPVE